MTDLSRDIEPAATADRFAHQLVLALVNLELHASHDAHVQDQLRAAVTELRRVAVANHEPVHLEIGTGAAVRHHGRVLWSATLQGTRLLELCRTLRLAALEFLPQLDAAELLTFLELLRAPRHLKALSTAQRTEAFAALGIRSVVCLEHDGEAGRGDPDTGGQRQAMARYQALVEIVQRNHIDAHRGAGLDLDRTHATVEQTTNALEANAGELFAVAGADDLDDFTFGHTARVTLLALQAAHAADVDRQQALRVGAAALLHDIGKARVAQDVLLRRGRSADEQREFAAHARRGAELLAAQQGVDPAAIGAAYGHHISRGGTGTPTPALHFEPSGVTHLVRICDVFETLTAPGPDHPGLPPLQAYAVMLQRRQQFDPRWLRFFIRAHGLHPVGTQVELDQGEQALVIAPGASLHAPVVRRLTGPAGTQLPRGVPTVLTIGERREGRTPKIRAVTAGVGQRLPLPDAAVREVVCVPDDERP
ncbi:MAG: HD domain-containing phosphohydrolase [Planctomycetota bacterium]